jgi:hypothetical protein
MFQTLKIQRQVFPVHDMKAHRRGVKVQDHSLLTWTLVVGE